MFLAFVALASAFGHDKDKKEPECIRTVETILVKQYETILTPLCLPSKYEEKCHTISETQYETVYHPYKCKGGYGQGHGHGGGYGGDSYSDCSYTVPKEVPKTICKVEPTEQCIEIPKKVPKHTPVAVPKVICRCKKDKC